MANESVFICFQTHDWSTFMLELLKTKFYLIELYEY